MAADEIFEIVDEQNNIIGTALRRQCHGNPSLRHRAAHVVVFDRQGRILLQKRSALKDVQPGKWDSAVGGHLMPGEDFEEAARREMAEELGIPPAQSLRHLFDMRISNMIESENVITFATVYEGPFVVKEDEIDEIRFWTEAELRAGMSEATFTPNCILEIERVFEGRHQQIKL